VALVAIPLTAIRRLRREGSGRWVIGSALVAGVATVALAASVIGDSAGLAQRIGLSTVDGWLMAAGISLLERVASASDRPNPAVSQEKCDMTDQNPSPDVGETAAVGAYSDGAYTLFAADFSDAGLAMEVYETLKEIEDGATVEIEGVLVVARDADGTLTVQKVTDKSTRSGLRWGVLGGVVLGVFFPPSIIASAVVLGAAGTATGKAREVHHRKELAKNLEDAIAPGHSGILALVSDPGAVRIRKALEKADRIVESAVDDATAKDLKAAAKEAQDAEG